MAKRTRWIVTVVAACSAGLIACGEGNSQPPAVCTHAFVPATGPGDVDHLFPVEVGRTWSYRTCCSGPGTQNVSVAAPTTVQGEPASVLTNTWTLYPYGGGTESGSGSDAYAIRPAGVYLVSSTDATSPLDQALPILVLPFPVQVPEQALQVACQHVRFVEEGVAFDTDIAVSFDAVTTGGTLTVSGTLTFTDVAYVFRRIDLTLRARGTTATGSILVGDWYAPGVGLIKEESTLITEGYMGTDGIELTSYAAPSPVVAPSVSPSLAAEPDRPVSSASSPGELALRIARRVAGLHR